MAEHYMKPDNWNAPDEPKQDRAAALIATEDAWAERCRAQLTEALEITGGGE